MTGGTVSVIMANYNHGHYIVEALEGILIQSFRPLEVIVIDDASTDNSVEIIEQFVRRDPVVRLLRHEQNRGAIAAVNLGLKHASGDYLLFHSADDKLIPGFFEKSMNILAQYPQAGLCSSLSQILGESGEELGFYRSPMISRTPCFLPPSKVLATLRRFDGWFVGPTVLYQRAALSELGGFDAELGSYADGFACRVIALKYGACFIPELLAMLRLSETSYSSVTMANPDVALEIMHHAIKLMRSTYGDLFPPEWVDAWERRWLCTACSTWVSSSQNIQIAGLRQLVPSPTLADRAFFRVLRWYMRFQHLITKLYLFTRFRHDLLLKPGELWNLLMRKLNRFSYAAMARSHGGKKGRTAPRGE